LFGFGRKFDSADLRHALPKCKTVERLASQARENFYTIFQLAVDAEKEAALPVFRPLFSLTPTIDRALGHYAARRISRA